MPDAGSETDLAYGSSVTRVRTVDPDTLAWLREFLGPAFERTERSPDARVSFDASPGAYGRWRDGAAPCGEEMEVFTLDAGRDLWSTARGRDGVVWAHAEARGVALRLVRDADAGLELAIVAESERPHGRAMLMRAVRELASTAALARGELPLHASVVCGADGATAFIGAKRAGKSTLQLYALGHGARFLANDRAFASAGEKSRVRAMPSIVSLREGSLDIVSGLRDALESGAWHHPARIAESRVWARECRRVPWTYRRAIPGLSPAQLCALLDVEAVGSAPLVRLVFPSIDPSLDTPAGFELAPLAPVEAQRRLANGGLLAGGRSSAFLAFAPLPEPSATEASARSLLAKTPCHSLRLGPAAYATRSLWDSLEASEGAA